MAVQIPFTLEVIAHPRHQINLYRWANLRHTNWGQPAPLLGVAGAFGIDELGSIAGVGLSVEVVASSRTSPHHVNNIRDQGAWLSLNSLWQSWNFNSLSAPFYLPRVVGGDATTNINCWFAMVAR